MTGSTYLTTGGTGLQRFFSETEIPNLGLRSGYKAHHKNRIHSSMVVTCCLAKNSKAHIRTVFSGDRRRLERWGLIIREQWERLKAINNRAWPRFCFRDFSLAKVQERPKADRMDKLRLF